MKKKTGTKNKRGLFFVIEGSDGSGKTEQSRKLVGYFRRKGFRVAYFDFPQYRRKSSYFVKNYLNGKYGSLYQVSSYKASVFYALDRFEAGFRIKKALEEGKIVISNRYLGANLIHQGSKIKDKKERIKFYRWVVDFEFNILEIPKPDLNILLYVPAKIAYKLAQLSRKRKEVYIKSKKDIHEKNINHLKEVEKIILEVASLYPDDFKLVKCVQNKSLLPIKTIHQKILTLINEKIEKS